MAVALGATRTASRADAGPGGAASATSQTRSARAKWAMRKALGRPTLAAAEGASLVATRASPGKDRRASGGLQLGCAWGMRGVCGRIEIEPTAPQASRAAIASREGRVLIGPM